MAQDSNYSNYKNSNIEWVGQIPEHWRVIPNKRVMHKEKRICEKWNNEDILSLTMGGVIVRDLFAGGKMPSTFDGYQYAYSGELLMCLFDIDVTPRCIGRVKNDGITSPAYSAFVVNEDESADYYYYYYLMVDNTKELLHLAKNLRHSFTEEQLGFLKVPNPPVEEQRAIAAYLDEQINKIDILIEEARSSVEEYRSLKEATIFETVTKGIRSNRKFKNSENEWFGDIPVDWDVCKTLFVLSMPITDGPHTTPELYDTGVPFVSAEAVSCGNGKIDFSHIRGYISEEFYQECCQKYIPKINDIYMIKSGATTGKVAVVDTEDKFTIWSPLAVFRVNEELMYYKYLFYFLQSEAYQKQVQLEWTYGTQQNIGMRTLEKLKVCLPSKGEQIEIADYLDKNCGKFDVLIQEKEALVSDLEDYKKSLIYEVVTGKRKVV